MFFYTILGFIESHSGELGDFEGFVQLIPVSYKGDKPVNITGIDKVHSKCDCIDGTIVNGIREPILYGFGITPPPGHIISNQPKIKQFKKINKNVLSHNMFHLEDDDHKPVDFNGETKSFTCQLIKL